MSEADDRAAYTDKLLLAWARERAAHPIEWGLGGPMCAFCKTRFLVTWEGAVLADHADGCLAVRANTPRS